MLSLRDCLDYCDLNEDEIVLIAHHEHLDFPEAAQLSCCLVQSDEGTQALRSLIQEEVCDAATCGGNEYFATAERAFVHFNTWHPPH